MKTTSKLGGDIPGCLVEGLLCAKDNELGDWIPPSIGKLIKAKGDPIDGDWKRHLIRGYRGYKAWLNQAGGGEVNKEPGRVDKIGISLSRAVVNTP